MYLDGRIGVVRGTYQGHETPKGGVAKSLNNPAVANIEGSCALMIELILDPVCTLHGGVAGCPDNPGRLSLVYPQTDTVDEGLDILYRSSEGVARLDRGRSLLETFHHPAYVAKLREAAEGLTESEYINMEEDAFVSRYSHDAAAYGFALIEDLMGNVCRSRASYLFAARPAGHHAHHDHASGFCLVANAAFAAHCALRNRKRVLIVDIDAHHGDGTLEYVEHGFFDEEDVFVQDTENSLFISAGQEGLWPGMDDDTGPNYILRNLPPGIGDGEFIEFVETEIEPAVDDFAPDVVVVSAGFDMCRYDAEDEEYADALGLDMHLTGRSYEAVQEALASIPTLYVLEGGYTPESIREGIEAICG